MLNTSRTAEMCMSEAQYVLSKRILDFPGLNPIWVLIKIKSTFMLNLKIIFPKKILDLPIIISSSGACINVLQENGGYAADEGFYLNDFPDPRIWRKNITSYLSGLNILFLMVTLKRSYLSRK